MSFRVPLGFVFVFLAIALPAQADLNILAIGDSHTEGKNDTDEGIFRSTYRPYLDQSIRNFQALGLNDADTVTVNWLGNRGGKAAPVPNDSPIPVDGNWPDLHQAVSGVSALHYDSGPANSLLNGTPVDDHNLVLLLLGSNDFGMFPSSTARWGWSSSRFRPTEIVDSIVDLISGFPMDTETLIAAIPPVDVRRRYTATTAGNYWFESERINGANGAHQDLVHWDGERFVIGPGVDNRDASTNDIIDAVNYALQQWAENESNVSFVSPFHPDGDYHLRGATELVDVNSGDPFNLVPNGDGHLDLLTDGIHLSSLGDQYYAAAFWEGGVRSALTNTAAAQAVPEPSSFLFLALLSMLVASARKYAKA